MKMVNAAGLGLLALAALWPTARAGDKEGPEVKLGKFTSRAPANWKADGKGNKFRVHQFKVPGPAKGEDAEVVVFYFDGGGGGIAQNIERWKSMFKPPEGKTLEDVAKVTSFKVGDIKITYLDVSGTYQVKNPPFDPNAKLEKRPDHRMLSVYFDSEDGPYFIRMVGPAKTIDQGKKGFDDWLKNFK